MTTSDRPGSPAKHLIIVPTYNEHDTIGTLLLALEREVPTADVLVVDDSSPDGTAGVVQANPRYGTRIFLLERQAKDGLGAAYRTGFSWAITHDYAGVVQMDADLSHPPEQVPALITALDHADVAVGSRYVHGGRVASWTPARKLLSRGGNYYVRVVLALTTHDATAGFKAFRMSALHRIEVTSSTSNGYCFQIENTWRAERRGLRVVEIPITFTDRTLGESKMSNGIVREALTQVLIWRLREFRAWSPASRSGVRSV
jgi:dolichol-phosphate mannosyltransferase